MDPKYKILFPLCLVLFIDAIGASVVFPILPELFLNTHYGLIKDMGIHSRNLLFGLTMGVFPLVTLFGMPVFGVFSDRYGRKNLIFIGLLGVVLSYALSIVALFSHSLIVFVIGRIVGGFCVGTSAVVMATIADSGGSVNDKMESYRWPALAVVVGFIIGPLIGGTSHIFDGLYSLVIPFAIGMLLTSLNLCLVRWLLVDTFIPALDDVRAGHIVQRGLMAVGDTVRAIRNDKLFRLFLGYLATQFSGGAYLQSISLYLAEYFNYSAGKISIFFAAMGVAVLFNLLLIQGYAQRLLSPRTIIRLCALTVACMFGIQLLAIGVLGTSEKSVLEVVVWSSSLLIYGGFNLSITTYTALLSDGTSSRDQGKVMAACGQLSGVAWFISGFMVGYLVMSHQMLLMAICVAVTLLGFLAIKKPRVESRA